MKNLHIGCGKNYIKNWINIDINPPCDLKLDITKTNLPFKPSTISFIFTEHFIEHITLLQGIKFLTQCNILLKPSGILRLSTPDLEFLIHQYISKKINQWKNVDWTPKTPCQMVNEGLHNWGHKFVYDYNELTNVLLNCGFSSYKTVMWHESNYIELQNLECRPYNHELIIEAIK